MLSKTESTARQLFRHYFPALKPVYGLRPDWLKWPVTGNNLELDLYFPEIKVAVEVDGIQHGRPIAGMQRDFAAFQRQQARDLWKLERCGQLGITLYKLTIFDLTQRRFEPFVQRLAQTHRLRPNRLAATPRLLYAEAERLSRQRFHPPVARRKPGGLTAFCRWLVGR